MPNNFGFDSNFRVPDGTVGLESKALLTNPCQGRVVARPLRDHKDAGCPKVFRWAEVAPWSPARLFINHHFGRFAVILSWIQVGLLQEPYYFVLFLDSGSCRSGRCVTKDQRKRRGHSRKVRQGFPTRDSQLRPCKMSTILLKRIAAAALLRKEPSATATRC